MAKRVMILTWMVWALAACAAPETALPAPTSTLLRSAPTSIPTATPLPTLRPALDRFAQGRRLGRGVNLGNALEAPREGEWGMVLETAFFEHIAAAGFDTVRVPIRWSAHAATDPPYAIDEAFFRRIDWVVDQALANDLNVVINMHHYNPLYEDPAGHEDRFVAMWRQIAGRYRERPDTLYLEPLNEPHDKLNARRWNALLARVVSAIREVDPYHTIVVTGAAWGGVDGLRDLKVPPGESNYVCSFHYYEPFPFTHQGAEWVDIPLSTGVQWPGPPEVALTPAPAAREVGWLRQWYRDYNTDPAADNPCGPDAVRQDLDAAARWAERLDCALWMGEFGAYNKAGMASRVRWTAYVREQAEQREFAWAYWEFGAGFGVYDRAADEWNEGLLQALIP